MSQCAVAVFFNKFQISMSYNKTAKLSEMFTHLVLNAFSKIKYREKVFVSGVKNEGIDAQRTV